MAFTEVLEWTKISVWTPIHPGPKGPGVFGYVLTKIRDACIQPGNLQSHYSYYCIKWVHNAVDYCLHPLSGKRNIPYHLPHIEFVKRCIEIKEMIRAIREHCSQQPRYFKSGRVINRVFRVFLCRSEGSLSLDDLARLTETRRRKIRAAIKRQGDQLGIVAKN